MLLLLLLIIVKRYAEIPVSSYQPAATIKCMYLEECWFETGVLIIVRELDFSFHEANLSMKPVG